MSEPLYEERKPKYQLGTIVCGVMYHCWNLTPKKLVGKVRRIKYVKFLGKYDYMYIVKCGGANYHSWESRLSLPEKAPDGWEPKESK